MRSMYVLIWSIVAGLVLAGCSNDTIASSQNNDDPETSVTSASEAGDVVEVDNDQPTDSNGEESADEGEDVDSDSTDSDSTDSDSTDSDSGDSDSGDSTEPDDEAPGEGVGDDGGPELIKAYGEDVYERVESDAVYPGSAADTYSRYLIVLDRMQATRLESSPLVVEDTGFNFSKLDSQYGDVLYDFEDFVVGPAGVSDFAVNDRVMSEQIATVAEPVETSEGLRVEQGTSYLTADGNSRIVAIVAENGGDTDLELAIPDSRFTDNDNRKHAEKSNANVRNPEVLRAGESTDIVFWAARGNTTPDGVLNLKFSEDGSGGEVQIDVPFEITESAFFNYDDEGDVVGALSSDIAFATGSSELSAKANQILIGVVDQANQIKSDEPICVAGYADSVGDEQSNLTLSKARAAAVAAVLIENGIEHDVDSIGFGEEFAPGDELPDQESRRVDVGFGACES